jgi:hypothetical protein
MHSCNYWRRLGVPFIDPRGLGAVGIPFGRQSLLSVGWHTGQSGAPPDMNSACPVPDLLPFLAKLTVAPSDRLAHRTLSDAHWTVRCDHVTIGSATYRPLIVQSTVGRGRRWLTGQSGAHRTVQWIIVASRQTFPESGRFTWVQTGASDSPVCQTEQSFGCAKPRLFAILFSLFLALRQNMLVLKNNSLSLETHLVLVLHSFSIWHDWDWCWTHKPSELQHPTKVT